MNKPTKTSKTSTRGLTLRLKAFEKISAVKGLKLAPEMRQDLQALDAKRMSAEERSRFITRKYGRKSAKRGDVRRHCRPVLLPRHHGSQKYSRSAVSGGPRPL